MSPRVRVLVWYRSPGGGEALVVAACRRINEALAGTPGLLTSELLRAHSDPEGLLVMSEWESLAAFQVWEASTVHPETTATLRAYRDRTQPRPFEVYEVLVSHDESVAR